LGAIGFVTSLSFDSISGSSTANQFRFSISRSPGFGIVDQGALETRLCRAGGRAPRWSGPDAVSRRRHAFSWLVGAMPVAGRRCSSGPGRTPGSTGVLARSELVQAGLISYPLYLWLADFVLRGFTAGIALRLLCAQLIRLG
jgi:hypothetical protein